MTSNSDSDWDDETPYQLKMTQRLPVADFDDYDPNIPPQNGAEYLRRVQLEAAKEPAIKVANMCKKFIRHANETQEMEIEDDEESTTRFVSASEQCRMPKAVVKSTLARFELVRQRYFKQKCKLNDRLQVHYHPKEYWEDLFYLSTTTSLLSRLQVIGRMEQEDIVQLLQYQLEWISTAQQYTELHGLWLYASLAALDMVQTADVHSLLRQISRCCSKIRHQFVSSLSDNEQSLVNSFPLLASLNLIILIIGNFFGQKDLLDDTLD